MRRTYVGVTRELRRELMTNMRWCSQEVLDTEGLDENVQEPFRFKDGETVEVH